MSAIWITRSIFFGVTSLLLQIYTNYEDYAKYLKYQLSSCFAYVVSALMVSMVGVVLHNAGAIILCESGFDNYDVCNLGYHDFTVPSSFGKHLKGS